MIAWLVETLIASTLLMLAVLALRGPVAHLFGPRIAYALWLLPALRMILPPLPQPVVAAAPVAPLPYYVANLVAEASLPSAAASFDWTAAMVAIWIAGAAATAALFFVAYARLVARIRSDATAAGERDGFPIVVSPAVEGPLAIGILHPAIVLPADHAERYSSGELDLAIRHEVAHHLRGDLSANMVALVVRALHWFNPVAAIAHRAFRADQEMACDARVLAERSAVERCLYATALVKTACGRPVGVAAAMRGSEKLKRRVKMIGRGKASRAQLVIGSALIAILGGVSLGLTASAGTAAERIVHEVKSQGPMIALGGIVIPSRSVNQDVKPAPEDDVRPGALQTATRGRVEARALAEARRADAESARTFAEAERADAEARRAAAEADRAAAEAGPEGATTALRGGRTNGSCSAGARRIDFRPQLETPIVICVPEARAIRATVIASLRQTRASMARDPMMIDVRARVLKSLDEAIARMEADKS